MFILVFNHFDEEERACCFAFIASGVSCYCKCSLALSHGAMYWSAVCDGGISYSYSLTFCGFTNIAKLNRKVKLYVYKARVILGCSQEQWW